ncbi:unnamed protein product [Moneuplotes crassus]|uniref:Uncharacterized protein n=2 Tax=Euplotes crassus TaxID=5936 RepID=A0AAD1XM48_EUPCR|nr:unnamed protein product [Moneuplotes crassus]
MNPNESCISIINNQSIAQQKMHTSVEYRDSYQTYNDFRKDRTTRVTTHPDESMESFMKRPTYDSREAMYPSKFLSYEEDPLYDKSIESQTFFKSHHDKSRAYVTTAPLFKNKRAMLDRKERIEEIRDFKEMNKSMLNMFSKHNKTHLTLKVKKANEIRSIMKREQSREKARNLKMLKYLNKKEKQRNLIVRTQQSQERKNRNLLQKIRVNRSAQNRRAKREDQQFVSNFTQAKNIIEKQMFKGMMIKERRNIRTENCKRKEEVKNAKIFINHQAIPNKVFDTSVSHPMMFNSFISNEGDSQDSTIYTGDRQYDNNDQVSTMYGQSFIDFPQYTKKEKMQDRRLRSQKSFRNTNKTVYPKTSARSKMRGNTKLKKRKSYIQK